MPCTIKNPAEIDLSSLEPHIQGMYDYFDQKIGFNKPPTMVFGSDSENQANVLGKTAYYDPSSMEIFIYSDGRHPKDMLRSIAHELIHHKQNLDGRLSVDGYHGEGYYLKNKKLKKLEQEAMKYGNELMREYEDNLKLKERNEMSLKEWKNNELSGLLMKRFGILNEAKATEEDGEDADQNDGLEELDEKYDTSYGHEKPNAKERKRLKEDSGEDEAWNDWKNEHADDNHIEEIRKHLRALEDDRDYERDESEYDHDDYEDDRKDESIEETVSGRKDNERNRRNDDPRLREEDEPGMATEDPLLNKESKKLKESMRRILKKNKKIRLRFK